jgi:hypothetical protein
MAETTTFYTFPNPPPGRANRGWRRPTKAGRLLAMQYRFFPKIPGLPECGECEPKCPQNIPIVEMLAHAHLTS